MTWTGPVTTGGPSGPRTASWSGNGGARRRGAATGGQRAGRADRDTARVVAAS
ncbi:MAG: hypothetical protein ACR2K2_12560 [Mycobacteriales bacterium]